MLLLAALAVVLLTLAALSSVCDRMGPADPMYPADLGLVPVRCSPCGSTPDPSRRRSTAA